MPINEALYQGIIGDPLREAQFLLVGKGKTKDGALVLFSELRAGTLNRASADIHNPLGLLQAAGADSYMISQTAQREGVKDLRR